MKIAFKRRKKKKIDQNETFQIDSVPYNHEYNQIRLYEVTSLKKRVTFKLHDIVGFSNMVVKPFHPEKNFENLNRLLSKSMLKVSSDRNVLFECGLYLSENHKIGRVYLTQFREFVEFPVLYRDLTPDSFIEILLFSVLSPFYRLKIGTFRIHIFTQSGILKTGNYTLRLFSEKGYIMEQKYLDINRSKNEELEWLDKKLYRYQRKLFQQNKSKLHPERRKRENGEEITMRLHFPVFHPQIIIFHPERYFERVKKSGGSSSTSSGSGSSSTSPHSISAYRKNKKKKRKKQTSNIPPLKKKASDLRKTDQILDMKFESTPHLVEDSHIGFSNPTEEKFFKLSTQFSLYDHTFIKPSTNDLKKINKILDRTPLDPIDLKDKFILWKYRRYLMSNKRALVKFLKTVQWNDTKEFNESKDMIEKWAEIDHIDALECLGYYFAQVPFVREYAVNRLKKLDDEQVREILLQLVQSLRYEKETIIKGTDHTCSPLVSFLLERSCKNFVIANFLEWYLRSEFEDPSFREMYLKVHHLFRVMLLVSGRKDFSRKLDKQKAFVEKLRSLRISIKKKQKGGGKGRLFRITRLRKALGGPSWKTFFDDEGMSSLVTPRVNVNGLQPEKAHIYKSNLAPWLIPIMDVHGGKNWMIYKTGNDLRQGQLVIQIFRLMDNIMKRNALDLKLTPFEILSCSSSDGFVQCIHPVVSLTDIIYKDRKTIRTWLWEKSGQFARSNPSINRELYFNEACDNFIRSSAGYGVITYILGIGDRHLENILLQDNGRMFHIDFDYILGEDPKKFPPPMKIAPQMVEALKNMKTLSEENGYTKFIELCCNSYIILRRYSSLILNLFILMLDSNIPDLKAKGPRKSQNVNRMQKLNKIKEKFKLNLSDNEAIRAMRLIIEESEKAVFSKLNEAFHRYAQYWRE